MFVTASAHPELLDAWRLALGDRAPTVEVRRADALAECLTRLQPQLALLDVRLTHVNSVRVVADLMKRSPDTRIVVLSSDLDEDQELALFRAGVRGVCALDSTADTLTRVVSAVLQGELWIRRTLIAKLVDSLGTREMEGNGATGRFAVLTPREIEIARLIGEGASNKHIARHLSITEQTVKGHLTAIFRKTGVDDRVRLALLVARRH
jgi:two-component system nitrate/nitrite response regulator NarL